MMSKLNNGSISIFEALESMRKDELVIPVFQRKFEWDINKIESLWDSILQGFPISTFLLWNINNDNVTNKTPFYHVIKEIDYTTIKKRNDEAKQIRKKATYSGLENTAILDGQQRLNSLYLSLFGNIYIKKNSNRCSCSLIVELDQTKIFEDENDVENEAPKKKKFNKQDIVWRKKYDIRFSTSKALTSTEFEVKRILEEKFKNKYTRDKAIEEAISMVTESSKEYARTLLQNLCSKLYDEKLIIFTLAEGMKEEDALEMFVRFNSGGMRLTVAEITSSILQVYWEDAENKFDSFLTGEYSNFGYDFIIRSAHLLWGDVVKSNLNPDIVDKLKFGWEKYCDTLNRLKDLLLDEFHIDVSYFAKRWNVLLPVIYEIYYNPEYKSNSSQIMAYLARAVLFGYFRNGTTGKLSKLSKRIKNQNYQILLADLDDEPDLKVTEDKLETILDTEYRNKISGDVLFFLSLDWNKGFDCAKDHMHPQSAFLNDIIDVDPEERNRWLKLYNKLPNLQYLPKSTNERKNDRPLDYWLSMEADKDTIRKQAMIPYVSLNIQNFDGFYKARKEILREKLKELLGGKKQFS